MLPVIANFFGVWTDELLCVDAVSANERIREYLRQGEILFEKSEYQKAVGYIEQR